MGRYCYVCKVSQHRTRMESLSFHRLPADPIRRKVWLSSLNIEENDKMPKVLEVCSNHFAESDYEIRGNNRRMLKLGAYPIVSWDEDKTDSSSSSSSESSMEFGQNTETNNAPNTVDQSPPLKRIKVEEIFEIDSDSIKLEEESPRNSPISDIPFETNTSSRVTLDELPMSTIYITDPPFNSFNNTDDASRSSSTTMSIPEEELAIEINEEKLKAEAMRKTKKVSEKITKDPLKIQPKKRKIRYVGDLRSEDFKTPSEAQQNFEMMKNTIINQRSKIKSLHSSVAKYRKRIHNLKCRLKYLNSNIVVSDSSDDDSSLHS